MEERKLFEATCDFEDVSAKLRAAYDRYMRNGSVVAVGEMKLHARRLVEITDEIGREEELRCLTRN